MLRNTLLGVVWALLLLWVVGVGPLCWILRDGLGPKSVESFGLRAVVRFLLTCYWGPVAVILLVLVVLLTVWRPRPEEPD